LPPAYCRKPYKRSGGGALMTRHVLFALILVFSPSSFWGQNQTAVKSKPTKVALSGDSVLETKVNGKAIRVVVTTYRVDLGSSRPTRPPTGEENTNCTYSSFPCNQVSNISIWVAGKRLIVPRSVFADRADVGNMSVTSEVGMDVLTLVGGDAAEAYSAKVFFDAHRIKKRELFDLESNSLLEVTTYLTPPVLN
jgi:hypothetical protein